MKNCRKAFSVFGNLRHFFAIFKFRHIPTAICGIFCRYGCILFKYKYINKENSGYASSAIVIISVRVFSRSSGVMSSVPVRGLFVTVQMHSAFLPAAAAFI